MYLNVSTNSHIQQQQNKPKSKLRSERGHQKRKSIIVIGLYK